MNMRDFGILPLKLKLAESLLESFSALKKEQEDESFELDCSLLSRMLFQGTVEPS